MRYLLDTTVLIDHAKGRPGVAELVDGLFAETGDLFTCDVVMAEALTGGDADERTIIEALLQALEYVATAPDAAAKAAEFRRTAGASAGRSLGDALIAGVALLDDLTVVTRNPADFRIEGIRVRAYD